MLQRIAKLEREVKEYRSKFKSTFEETRFKERLEDFAVKFAPIKADASKPPRLGVVGTVSSGKTQTVEILLGDVGGALAEQINASATTGNIVEYAVSVREEGDENDLKATYSNWEVLLLNEKEIRQVFFEVAEFLADVLRRASKIDERNALNALIERAKNNARNYYDEIGAWLRQMSNSPDFEGLVQVKRTLKELDRLALCAEQGRRWFGKRLRVSQKQAAILSQFQTDDKIDAAFQKSFPDYAKYKYVEDEQNVTVTIPETEPAAELLPFFAMVRKIYVDVKISRRLGDYYGLTGRNLLFSDCPGFNAENTMARDHALCLVEMNAVDCVLSLVKSDEFSEGSPFNLIAYKKWGDAREKTILGVSQFDKFTTSDHGWQALDALLTNQGLLAEETVFQTLEGSLGDLYRFCEDNAMSGNFVFYSSFAFINSCARLFESTKKVEDIRRNEDARLSGNLSKWRSLADKLPQNSFLRAILENYVADGGGRSLVGRLLNIVEQKTHAQRRRLAIDLSYCESEWQDLKRDVETAAKNRQDAVAPKPDGDPNDDGDWNRTLETLQKFRYWLEPFDNKIPPEFEKFFVENFEKLRERVARKASSLIHETMVYDKMPVWEALFRSLDSGNFTIPMEKEQNAQNMWKPTNAEPLRKAFASLLTAIQKEIFTFAYGNAERERRKLRRDPRSTIVDKSFKAYVRKKTEQAFDCKFPSKYEFAQLFAQMEKASKNPNLSDDARKGAQTFCDFYRPKCEKEQTFDATRLPLLFEDLMKDLMDSWAKDRPVESFCPHQSTRTFVWAYELWTQAPENISDKQRHLMMLSELRASYEEAAAYFTRGNVNFVKTHYLKSLKERGYKIVRILDNAIAVCRDCLALNSDGGLDGDDLLGGDLLGGGLDGGDLS